MGLLVPFFIRWMENKSRLSQARHLLQVIQTREEISQILNNAENEDVFIPKNEEIQLRYFQKELEKELRQSNSFKVRLYPILISIELFFFITAIFYSAVTFFERLIFGQGSQSYPFLEGIFSTPNIRIAILVLSVIQSVYWAMIFHKKQELKWGASLKTEIVTFGIFNLGLICIVTFLGILLFLLDWVLPWF